METNNIIKKLPIISATVLIFCFFLPWFKTGIGISSGTHSVNLFTFPLLSWGSTYTGYDMLGLTSEMMQIGDLPYIVGEIIRTTPYFMASIGSEAMYTLDMISDTSVPGYIALGYLVILIPFFGVSILVLNAMRKINLTKIVTLVAGIFGLLLFLFILIGYMNSSINIRDYLVEMGGPMVNPNHFPNVTLQFFILSIGSYLLPLASLGCIVSFFVSFKSDQ